MSENFNPLKSPKEDPSVTIAQIQAKGAISAAKIAQIGAVVVAALGCLAAFATGFFGFLPEPSGTAIVATIAAPNDVVSLTSTLVNADVEEPLVVTPFPTLSPGLDWYEDCIDLAIWTPYLGGVEYSFEAQCEQLGQWGITAQDGVLFLNTLDSASTAMEYGIIVPLQTRSEIELVVDIKKLENSEIWIGILDQTKTDKFSGFMIAIQSETSMDFRAMPYGSSIVDNKILPYAMEQYPVKIIVDVGKISVWVGDHKLIKDYRVRL